MRKLLTALLTTGALLGAAGSVSALTTGTSFTVSATVLKTCSVTATNLGFPNFTPGSGPQTATSTISVNCTKGTGFTVALDKGTTAGGTEAQRLMAQGGGGTGTLQYNLCTTAVLASGLCNGASAWGDGTGGTITQAGTGAGMAAVNAQTLTVNGGLPDNAFNQAAAVAASGSSLYSDTVAVTVTY
jgi:spore coat protein U-like protein